ncbi:MAG: MFS transporter, partial [Cyclobacteriaceae bacterium]|nr:MFS transporter [Cyclobacteriaceae bacterium]
GLFFFTSANLEWGILCSVLASLGYAGSLVFYDAYLPEIVTEDRLDDVSARGYSFGYTGSVILMIVNIIMIEKWELFGFSSQGLATRFAFLTVGLWWIGFAQIPFRKLPQRVIPRAPGDRNLLNGFHELRKVWDSLAQLPDLKRFLFAYFFYNMGVQTVMYLAATFGAKELQLESSKLIATVLIIQLVAAVGAWIFSRVSHRKGNKFSLMVMIIIWIAICGMAYLTHNEYEFYGIAVLVGLVMGGIQALSRATYSKLIPRDTVDTASYFSFYDVLYNLCLAIGTFTYGLIEHLTGSMRNSTLALMVFFVLGLLLLWRVTIKHVPGAQPSSNA